MIQLKLATQVDIDMIQNLAQEIWNAHYIDIIGKEQVDYMLTKMYDTESLTKQMTIDNHEFYLIHVDDHFIGFVSTSTNNEKDYFIHKFYIQQNKAAKGLGTNALSLLTSKFKPTSFTLTVNRQNYKSINFYFKNGFVIDHVADFEIGDGYVMNDFVMKKQFV